MVKEEEELIKICERVRGTSLKESVERNFGGGMLGLTESIAKVRGLCCLRRDKGNYFFFLCFFSFR